MLSLFNRWAKFVFFVVPNYTGNVYRLIFVPFFTGLRTFDVYCSTNHAQLPYFMRCTTFYTNSDFSVFDKHYEYWVLCSKKENRTNTVCKSARACLMKISIVTALACFFEYFTVHTLAWVPVFLSFSRFSISLVLFINNNAGNVFSLFYSKNRVYRRRRAGTYVTLKYVV